MATTGRTFNAATPLPGDVLRRPPRAGAYDLRRRRQRQALTDVLAIFAAGFIAGVLVVQLARPGDRRPIARQSVLTTADASTGQRSLPAGEEIR